jgi:THO complex subunit 4
MFVTPSIFLATKTPAITRHHFHGYCAMSRWKRGGFVRRGQGRVSFPQRGRGQVRSRGRGRGRSSFVQSRGRGYVRRGNAEKSAKQLDKELDNYNSGAMNVD